MGVILSNEDLNLLMKPSHLFLPRKSSNPQLARVSWHVYACCELVRCSSLPYPFMAQSTQVGPAGKGMGGALESGVLTSVPTSARFSGGRDLQV